MPAQPILTVGHSNHEAERFIRGKTGEHALTEFAKVDDGSLTYPPSD